jgi:hypothetical protein
MVRRVAFGGLAAWRGRDLDVQQYPRLFSPAISDRDRSAVAETRVGAVLIGAQKLLAHESVEDRLTDASSTPQSRCTCLPVSRNPGIPKNSAWSRLIA